MIKNALVFSLTIITFIGTAKGLEVYQNPAEAIAAAKSQEKDILVMDIAGWCSACAILKAKMEQGSYDKILSNYVILEVWEDKDKPFDARYEEIFMTKYFPTLRVHSSDFMPRGTFKFSRDSNVFAAGLKQAAAKPRGLSQDTYNKMMILLGLAQEKESTPNNKLNGLIHAFVNSGDSNSKLAQWKFYDSSKNINYLGKQKARDQIRKEQLAWKNQHKSLDYTLASKPVFTELGLNNFETRFQMQYKNDQWDSSVSQGTLSIKLKFRISEEGLPQIYYHEASEVW